MIGQHAALSSGETNILNTTIAAPGRVRGTGEIAGEIIVNEIVQGISSEDNTTTSSPIEGADLMMDVEATIEHVITI